MKGARPIPDKTSYNFITKNINGKSLYEKNLVKDFCNSYSEWIQSSKLNNLENLNKFKSLQFVHGTAQSFDFFYLQNHNKQFRILRGDFMYHQIMFRNNLKWEYILDNKLKKGDAVILSLPFSDYGDIHPLTDMILNQCDKLDIPVFVDCAYMIMSRNIDFDFNRKCIQGISFSMSKGFYGAEHLRIGIRFTKEYIDDGVEVFNSFEMVNWTGPDIGLKLINRFDTDYLQNKYHKKQLKVCKELNIQPSKCVIFGITDKNHKEFGEFDRGTDWRRVCIANQIGDMKDLHNAK
jgi:hypothetical protein